MKTLNVDSKSCLECGDVFCKKSSTSRKKWLIMKYCSQKCSIKNTTVQNLDFDRSLLRGHVPWNKGKIGLHLNPATEFKKGNQINLGRTRLDMQGEKNFKWVESIITSCAHCSKELRIKPHQVKNRTRNFCNRECWALGTRGRGSPVFRGEEAVARFRNRVAQLPEYREWHAEVLKRDGYQCVLCKTIHTKSHPLEVDHIKRFFSIVQENGIMNIEQARECKELWDVENGRTVCRPCHRTLDTYGTKGLKRSKLKNK